MNIFKNLFHSLVSQKATNVILTNELQLAQARISELETLVASWEDQHRQQVHLRFAAEERCKEFAESASRLRNNVPASGFVTRNRGLVSG